ncbi:MAG: tetratricopeptide repeat protein [candidate division KSB1 bacterium]|nr:tetratricopeptide repeat protein [candidate division KSB1 bacterium]MDZ7367926.1 tetratricopeptide repeat protein [candidate division KSB1 bacterium]MDZ7406507.1 tetratricopeptide repeat protein [candidate division KSB1 bacterium]
MKMLVACWLLVAGFIISCAPATHYNRGREALDKEEYEKALAELRLAVKENPLNALAVRDLGIALYETQSHRNAALILEKAVERMPQDGMARLYLGLAYEKTGRLDDAIKLYRDYAEVSSYDYRRQLEARLDLAIQAKLRLEARQALAAESAIDPQSFPEKSLAVLNFRNLGGNAGFDPLAKGLADMVISDLSQVKALTVIERSRMQALLEEMGLGQTGLVDEQTAPRVGQLLGVKKVLQGSFLDLAGGRLRLDATLSDAVAKVSQPIGETSGELARFFRLEKNLVFKVIDELGINLTEAEEKAILTIPTENLLAFLAYSRGLEARDRGDFTKAQHEFQQAVKIDPKFSLARTQLEKASLSQMTRRELRAASRGPGRSTPLTAAQKRKLTLIRAALNSNPAFSFTNKNLAPTSSRGAVPANAKDLRQPLLEGRSVFGAKGEILIDIKLP